MNKKRLVIMSIISIFLVAILTIGSTYSIFISQDLDEELNVYQTGTLNVTYTLSSDNVTFTDRVPKSMEEADAVIPYRITVTNNGTVPYMFDVVLEDTTAGNVINYQYIMTKVGYLDAKSLDNCTSNVIKEDVILPAGSSVDIDVRVWLSDTTPNSEMGKSFYAKLKVDGEATYDNFNSIDNTVLSLNYMKGFNYEDTSYFHSDTYREKIKNISFVDYIDTSSAIESWDMSEKQDNSIVAWVVNNATSGYYDLFIGSNKMIFSKNLQCFFENMKYVDSINFLNLNTALSKNMVNMFMDTGYSSTTFTLDLGDKFDTSNVTNMSQMFLETGYSSTAFTLNLGDKFDTSKVTNMHFIFGYIGYSSTVFTLNLGNKFDTSKVTNMYNMFDNAGYSSPVFTLNLGDKFDTSNVTNMHQMFSGIGHSSNVFTLDLGDKFDTSNVVNMQSVFMGTGARSEVFTLDLGDKFDTSNVTDMMQMFSETGQDSTVFTLDLGDKFDTSKVRSMSYMFASIGWENKSFTLDLGDHFDTSNVSDMQYMFSYTGYKSTVFTLNLGDKFNTSNVTNMTSMFGRVGNSTSNLILDLSTFDFSKVTAYNNMFSGFSATKKIYVKDTAAQSWILGKGFSNLSTSNVLVKN